MKANELSIGDWVQARMITFQGEERLTPPMRVVAVGETWVQLQIDPQAGDPDEYDIEEIRPVPLTVDILLANGWDWSDYSRQLIKFFNDDPNSPYAKVTIWLSGSLHLELKTQQMGYKSIVRSVHELQHAIRLAGLEKEFDL